MNINKQLKYTLQSLLYLSKVFNLIQIVDALVTASDIPELSKPRTNIFWLSTDVYTKQQSKIFHAKLVESARIFNLT